MLHRLPHHWLTDNPVSRLLRPLALVFGALAALHRWSYARGWRRAERLDVPVLVIGNRIAGGAGKTPTLLAVLTHLRARGWQAGVVSRGHGGRGAGVRAVQADADARWCGDEPLLIRRRAGVPVWVGRDRVAAARALRAAHPQVDCLVCDDGLQHLRLARDIEVVVFDERGAGNGALLPAGPLREPIDVPARGRHLLVLYNAEQASTPLAGHRARRRLLGALALADWWAGHPVQAQALDRLRGRPVLAVAGIAQPGRFFAALRDAGLDPQECALPDHFDYQGDEPPWPPTQPIVLVTEKDAVKLHPAALAKTRPQTQVWVVPMALEPEPAFFAALDHALDHALDQTPGQPAGPARDPLGRGRRSG